MRDGDDLIDWLLLERKGRPLDDLIADVVAQVKGCQSLIAVEELVHPTPHMGLANVRGLLDTAQILGAVVAVGMLVVRVRPAKFGTAPLASYPAALVGEREVSGKGRLRHARAAWDIAGAGLKDHRR